MPDSEVDSLKLSSERDCKRIAAISRQSSSGKEGTTFSAQVFGVRFARANKFERDPIVITTPNAVTSAVHDRMPVILDPDTYDLWLDRGMKDVGAASELLKPYDARLMRCYPIGSRINHVANDDEECSRPTELAEIQNRLFS